MATGSTQPLTKNKYQAYLLWSKGGRCIGLTTLPPSGAGCLRILGASTSWSLWDLSRPVYGLLYLYFFFFFFFRWRYNPLWALACRTISLHFSLTITNSLHLLTPNTWRSLSVSSLHPLLGLPLRLVPSSSWVKIFLGILSFSILSRWPSQLILYSFIHLPLLQRKNRTSTGHWPIFIRTNIKNVSRKQGTAPYHQVFNMWFYMWYINFQAAKPAYSKYIVQCMKVVSVIRPGRKRRNPCPK